MDRRTFIRGVAASLGLKASLAMTEPLHAAPTREEFEAFQAKRRQELWGLLGDLPERRPPTAKLLHTEKVPGYSLEHLELDLNGVEPVPALLLLPERRPRPAPGLLYIHAHGGTYELGKEELL